MNLIELVAQLADPVNLNDFCLRHDSSDLTIYMEAVLGLNSAVELFGREETGGMIAFEKNGVKYLYVLEVDLAIDLLASDLELQRKGTTDLDRAKRLLHYAIYDA